MREKLDFRNADFMSFLGVRIRKAGVGVPGGGLGVRGLRGGFWSIEWEIFFLFFFMIVGGGRGDFCNKIMVLEGYGQRFF